MRLSPCRSARFYGIDFILKIALLVFQDQRNFLSWPECANRGGFRPSQNTVFCDVANVAKTTVALIGTFATGRQCPALRGQSPSDVDQRIAPLPRDARRSFGLLSGQLSSERHPQRRCPQGIPVLLRDLGDWPASLPGPTDQPRRTISDLVTAVAGRSPRPR